MTRATDRAGLGRSTTMRAQINLFGRSLLNTKLVQGAARTFPGLLWLLPFATERWEDTVVATVYNVLSGAPDVGAAPVSSHNEVFTPDNITLLLEKAGLSETAQAFERIREVQGEREREVFGREATRAGPGSSYPAPGVDVTCIYGKGVPTEETYQFASFSKVLPGLQPFHVGFGDGDGTVSLRSLRVCQEWIEPGTSTATAAADGRDTTEGRDVRGNRVTVKVFPGALHEAIVDLPSVITEVIAEATSNA